MEPNNTNENSGGMINNFGSTPNQASANPATPATPVASATPATPVNPLNPINPVTPATQATPANPATLTTPVSPMGSMAMPDSTQGSTAPMTDPFVNSEAGLAQPEKKNNKTRLILIIVMVLVVLVGVVVAVVVMNSGKGTSAPPAVPMDDFDDEEGVDDDEGSDEDAEDTEDAEDVDGTGNVPTKEDEATPDYEMVISRITNEIIGGGIEDSETIASIYKREIDAADNERVKAMLTLKYYETVMDDEADEATKKEILDGVVEVDNLLKTYASALTASKIAAYYGNMEMAQQYKDIADGRK